GGPASQRYLLHRQNRRSDGIRNLVLRDRSQIQIRMSAIALVGRYKFTAGRLAQNTLDAIEVSPANILNLVAAPKQGVGSCIPRESYRGTEVIQVARIRPQPRVRRVRSNEDQLACVRASTGRHPAGKTPSRNTEQTGTLPSKGCRQTVL